MKLWLALVLTFLVAQPGSKSFVAHGSKDADEASGSGENNVPDLTQLYNERHVNGQVTLILGQDGHDQLPHGHGQRAEPKKHKNKKHKVALLGKDGHDQKAYHRLHNHHGHVHEHKQQQLLGKDGHDSNPHHLILGQDGHDQKPHGRLLGASGHGLSPFPFEKALTKTGQQEEIPADTGFSDKKKHKIIKKLRRRFDVKKSIENFGNDFKQLLNDEESRRSLKKLQSPQTFKKFMKKHKKKYESPAEYQRRFGVFRENMKKVQFLRETERGTAKYGATKFADLTEEEFKKNHLGLKKRQGDDPPHVHWPLADIPDVRVPKSFDWRKYKAVTPVKNQGSCGSCWAFSVTGNIEGQWKLRRGKLLELSEQELVDCDSMDHGCEGGYMTDTYEAVIKLGGLETEEDYKYEGVDEACHFNKTKVRATITGGLMMPQNETQIAQWLFKNGPISIGINANGMQFYFGGIQHPWSFLCDPDDVDHGVLLVGFGIHKYPLFKKSMPFWIVKNSWGEDWGEQGYYRIYRGDGSCGINTFASSATVA